MKAEAGHRINSDNVLQDNSYQTESTSLAMLSTGTVTLAESLNLLGPNFLIRSRGPLRYISFPALKLLVLRPSLRVRAEFGDIFSGRLRIWEEKVSRGLKDSGWFIIKVGGG